MKSTFKKLSVLGLVISLQSFASAQFIPDPVSLNVVPESPDAGQTVTVAAATPTFDKDVALFSWTVDGRERPDLSGEGKHTITLTAGDVGSSMRVSVSVASSNGMGGSASKTIRVSDLVLAWFSETYVPKWYRGKALPTQASLVSIIAVPRIIIGGALVTPENLVYRWGLNDDDNILVGAGKQVFKIQTSDLSESEHHIRVSVEDKLGQVKKTGELFITLVNPHVAMYPASPLGGPEYRSSSIIFSSATRGLIDFSAEPFYFSVPSKKNLSYEWSIAGTSAKGTPSEPYSISINTGGQPVSVVPISVTVQSPNAFIKTISKTLTLLLQ